MESDQNEMRPIWKETKWNKTKMESDKNRIRQKWNKTKSE